MSDKHADLAGALAYYDEVRRRLDKVFGSQLDTIAAAAAACERAVAADGLIYLFGTGHSHILAEEGHYRAGGLAAVCPILMSGVMLHEGATTSSRLERLSGLAEGLLGRYRIEKRDVLFVFSTSGVNAVPVEAARYGRSIGATVVAITSLEYSRAIEKPPLGETLADVADIVLDNMVPPGDALVEVGSDGRRAGPLSTVSGALLLNAVLTETTRRLGQASQDSPVYVSANMPDAAANNERLVARYKLRNPHL